ncbi:MAG: hypothetical protein LBR77_09850 [Lachnospiraceae bacterium]|nr:hypothetical protein [Lachnospiraceae bacterium]
MIDFEEELEKFKPSLEVEDIEDALVGSDLTDMGDIWMDMMRAMGKQV